MSDQVYFVQQIIGGPVKIGVSWDVVRRLDTLTLWAPHPLKLLAVVPGDKYLERNIQDCFADCHYHHEWFHPNPRLMAAIALLASGVPLEQAVDLKDIRGNTLGNTQKATRLRNAEKRASA